MAPSEPARLTHMCYEYVVKLINNACCELKTRCPNILTEYEEEVWRLKRYLVSLLPITITNEILDIESSRPYQGDDQIKLIVLLHPEMTELKRCTALSLSEQYWINHLPYYNHLVILDLGLTCTDELIKIVVNNCFLIEELNIQSKIYGYKTYVSDEGLDLVKKLPKLRSLELDCPIRNERLRYVELKITVGGVLRLVKDMPNLESIWFHKATEEVLERYRFVDCLRSVRKDLSLHTSTFL